MDGITLQHHPGTLSRADLSNLGIIAGRLATQAPRFAAWLIAVADHEQHRRQVAEAAEIPTEPEMPVLDLSGWTTSEIAKTASASFAAYEVSAGDRVTPGSARLLRSAHQTVLAWLDARVGRLDKETNHAD